MLPPFVPGDLGDPGSLSRVLLDSMTEGVSLSSEEGTILYTNPAEDRLFGYAPGELVGQHVSVQNAYPPKENARVVAAVIAELARSGAWAGEWLNRRKDGTAFATRSRISAVEVDGRRCWLCVQSDVTEESAALRALQDERARLELATEAAGIGVWDWDIAIGAMTYSDRAKAISGLPLDQPVTLADARRVVHPEDLPHTSAQARRALDPAIRDRSAYEYRIRRPDGSVAWVLARGEAIFEEVAGETRAVRYLGTIQDVSARRALEDAHRDAAQRLRLAIQAGGMAVWDADLAADAVAGSPELNRLLGFPEDRPLDRREVRARYHPGEYERMRAEFRAALAEGQTSFETDFRYKRPDGETRWLFLRCDVQLGPDGAPRRAIGVLADITDRKRAEADLRASELRLQLASAVAGVGVWDWNILTGVTIWSPEEYALFGIDPATPQAELHPTWRRLIHPEDLSAVEAWIDRARQEAGTHPLDYRVLRGGETRWIRSRAAVVAGEDGRAERMVGIEWDVTSDHEEAQALRSRAEALEGEVEERQHQLDRFYALSNDLLAVAGFDGFLKTINPAWERLLGIPETELLSRPFIGLIHPDDHVAAAEVVGRLRSGSAIQEFQDRLVARDGRHHWIAWAAAAEGDRFYAVGRDVTREREREEALRQTQKMEALGQLTGGIAHDFNNLLQAVQGSFALIAKRPGEPERVRMLAEQGMLAARRGGGLTAQLLAFARSRQVDVRPIALGEALAGLGHLLRPSLGPMIEVALEPPEEGLAVVADATQLEMALLNLGINARDAMPEGGTVTIRAHPRRIDVELGLPPGDYVAVEVADTGAGMPREVAERAFEPFFTTKGLGRGTGLGLSQVYAMARQAGGTVRLASAPGQGTTVSILLPRGRLPLDGVAPREPAAPARNAFARRGTVLIVDDDADVRRWLASAVAGMGYGVIEAPDGPAGLRALDGTRDGAPGGGLEGRPDLLLVDFAMPGMTGAEVVEAARWARPDLPAVLVTGYAEAEALDRLAARGVAVLRKPFDLGDLEAVLDARLGPGAGASAAP